MKEIRRSVSCVIFNSEGKILVLEHKKCLGKLQLPAGTVEEAELKSTSQTAVREMKEELGIDIDVRHLILLKRGYAYYPRLDGHQIYLEDTYRVLAYSGVIENKEPHKHPNLHWMTPQELFESPEKCTYNTWLMAAKILQHRDKLERSF